MQLTTREKIANLLLDVNELKASKEKIDELLVSDPYARLLYLTEKQNINLEAYLAGEASLEEKTFLEKLLAEDTILKEEALLRKKVNRFLIEENLRNSLKAIHHNFTEGNQSVILQLKDEAEREERSYKKWLLAASIALLIGTAMAMFFAQSQAPLEQRLYAQYYQPLNDEMAQNYIVNSNSLNEAKAKYIEKNYRDALTIFNSLPNSLDIQTEKNFYISLSLMEMNSYSEAIENLNSVITNQNFECLPQAYWYLALCYLKTGERELAKNTLGYIVKTNGYNTYKAKLILKRLS